ncbi:MAG: threonine aldolase family protein [Acidimicrobiales bacterium]
MDSDDLSGGAGHHSSGRNFASDNYAGMHPAVLAAIAQANAGHQPSYGADECTARLGELMKRHFGNRCASYPVFNGTGANVIGLQAMTKRWDAVICAQSAHIDVDECGAPERVAGLKLLGAAAIDGKLTPAMVEARLPGLGDEHRAQPKVVSVSQATELGTCYTVDELAALAKAAHGHGLLLHMDGARLCNAAAWLDLPLRALTTDVGVDVLSFGGTKNGAMLGEAVVVLNPDAVDGMRYLRKAGMQLASKMRFISVQLEALLTGDLWLESARHANEMARRLELRLRAAGVPVTQAVQANAVFALLPAAVAARLREHFAFYTWDSHTGEVRLMTSWDTTEQDVDEFASLVEDEVLA